MPDNCVEPPSHPCIAHFLSYSMLERKELLFCVTIVLSFMCRQTHPSPVQIISHSLDQLILKPNSPSLMGTSVGSPDMGDAFKSSVCHSHHHPTPQTPPTSSAAMPLGQRSPSTRLALHPCTGTSGPGEHAQSLQQTYSCSHSARPPKHLTRVPASPPRSQHEGTQSMCSRVRGQNPPPHLTFPPGRGSDAGSQRLLQINPLTNPVSVLLTPSE